MLRKGFEILVLLKVLEIANDSEWVAPSFTQPKLETNLVRFLSAFRDLNKQLQRKPYPMPNINEILLKLEGFH